jgi:predicted ATPase with chaperone activity
MQTCIGEIRQFCQLQAEGQSLRRDPADLFTCVSSYFEIITTIADLAGCDEISSHIWRMYCNIAQRSLGG